MGHIDDSRDHKKQSEYRAALQRDIEINRARKAKEREDRDTQMEWWEKVSSGGEDRGAAMSL
jgi:hypothetical protein